LSLCGEPRQSDQPPSASQGDLVHQTFGLALEHIDALPEQRRNTRAVQELRLAVQQVIGDTR